MTKQELLRELRKPYWCYVRLVRSSYDGGKFWDRSFLVNKGMLVSSIQDASDVEVFNVEIEKTEKSTYGSRDKLTLRSCVGN